MALDIVTWLWGDKYGPQDVERLQARVRRHLGADHGFHLFSDRHHSGLRPDIRVGPIDDPELIGRGCFCRLRLFDPDWQARHGLRGTIVQLDLDALVVGKLDPLFETEASFKILQGANAANPNPYNASVVLLQAGEHAQVWREFSPERAAGIRKHEFPDDQGWLWHMLPEADGWPVGKSSGIYAFQKPGWPGGTSLPADARLVAFFGWRKPEKFLAVPWIKQYYSEAAA